MEEEVGWAALSMVEGAGGGGMDTHTVIDQES